MKMLVRAALALSAFSCTPMPALAQAPLGKKIFAPAGFVTATGIYCDDGTGTAVQCSFSVDTVTRSAAVDRGLVAGTTALTLMPANLARRGFVVQNQSASATCYISGQATATVDYHSLLIAAGAYYETSPTHVGSGAVSIICTAANVPIYSREF